MMGAMLALRRARGLGVDMLGWLWILRHDRDFRDHPRRRRAGRALGRALLFPGDRSRLDSLAEAGRVAGTVALGTTLMLLIAGFLEGIGRQVINDTPLRFRDRQPDAAVLAVLCQPRPGRGPGPRSEPIMKVTPRQAGARRPSPRHDGSNHAGRRAAACLTLADAGERAGAFLTDSSS